MTQKEKIVPKGTRILVSRKSPEETTESGIIIYGDATSKMKEFAAQTRATVVALGELAFEENPDEKPEVGESVIIRRYSGVSVDDDQDYGDVLVNDHDVIAKVELVEGEDNE